MKMYSTAPLPFVGQKRKFIKEYVKVLATLPDDAVYIDLFGGSGLLAHVAHRLKPGAHVVYNDYDNYSQRLAAIPQTNLLLDGLREVLRPYPRASRLPEGVKAQCLTLIAEHERVHRYVDYNTISPSLMFSGKSATSLKALRKQTFYNTIRRTPYTAEAYLDGLDVRQGTDYRQLADEYADNPNVVLLVDPPYLATDVITYTMSWTLRDYLDVLKILSRHRYVYFTSNKSNIVELCDWLEDNPALGNPFAEATRVDIPATINYNSSYTDIMLFK